MIARLFDVSMVPLAWFLAYALRFNFEGMPDESHKIAIESLFPLWIVQVLAYRIVGLHRGIWRFASIPDLLRIFQAVSLGFGLFLLTAFLINRLEGIPRSITPLYALLLIFLLGGARLGVRWLKSAPFSLNVSDVRVLIVGAGRAAEGVIRELRRGSMLHHRPVAIVDDRHEKKGQELQGVRVLGTCDDIPQLVEQQSIEMIIIAIPSARGKVMRRLVDLCAKTACQVRILPGLSDVVAGRLSIDALRTVSLEDLLGREQVMLDKQGIHQEIQKKVLLVSGGGGSIGSELCRQIASYCPQRLVIVEQSEYALFTIEQELKASCKGVEILPILMNVCDKVGLRALFQSVKPEIVLHAAAYKHVPLLESQLRQALYNNVVGTYTLAAVAAESGVDKFLLVSSDKAVHPTNVMGATKRASELICSAFNQRCKTHFLTVRFGNVLDSAGSVIPTFRRQLESGGPLTVTHPEITRFFMTIPEAVQLILQALTIGKGGELFVLDMGDPIKIRFLAEQMIRLAGKKLGEDIDIQYIGLRPGEKLYEELFYSEETLMPTQHTKIFRTIGEPIHDILSQVKDLAKLCTHSTQTAPLMESLHAMVPEWVGSGDHGIEKSSVKTRARKKQNKALMPRKKSTMIGTEIN
jgi:FlaA1/EpsC-like NDP-sugar epimerase